MTTQTSRLTTYKPASYPQLEGGESAFLIAELDKIRNSLRSVQQIMVSLENAGTVRSKAGAVVAADLDEDTWAVIHDTSGATIALYANIGGTLKSVALT